MKPEIKQRIEQIHRGELPEGYKKTKIGTIPTDWNICTINDIATVSSGSTPNRKSEEYWNGNIPWITTGELENGFVKQTKEAITTKALTETNLKMYLPGTLLMAMYGQGKTRGTVARLCIEATVNQACAAIVVRSGLSDYVFYVLQKAYDNIRKLSNSGSQDNLNADIIRSLTIIYPSISEQQKIVAILATLDKVIELYEKKIEQLQLLKKICLRKMFPRHGKSVPEVRFTDFIMPLEQYKAKEIFEETSDKNHPNLPVLAATQDQGMVKREDNGIKIFHDRQNEAGYKRVLPGQFVIHLRSFQGGFAHSAVEGITSPAYTVFGFKQPEMHCDYYWKYIFLSDDFVKRLETVTYGIRDGRNINYDEFLDMTFFVPSYKEQKAISIFLLNLDHLITLHQRRLDEEKRKKKALMQLLLTGIVRV